MAERKKKFPNRHVYSDDELENPVSGCKETFLRVSDFSLNKVKLISLN